MRLFSPPPPPPADAAPVLEELVTHRVREKVQGDLRQDRQELYNKIDSAMQSLNDKIGGVEKTIGGVEKSLNDKIGGVEKSLNDKMDVVEKSMGTNFHAININLQAMDTKIDSTKVDISVRAAGFAFAGGAAALSVVGFMFETKVDMVDTKPALS